MRGFCHLAPCVKHGTEQLILSLRVLWYSVWLDASTQFPLHSSLKTPLVAAATRFFRKHHHFDDPRPDLPRSSARFDTIHNPSPGAIRSADARPTNRESGIQQPRDFFREYNFFSSFWIGYDSFGNWMGLLLPLIRSPLRAFHRLLPITHTSSYALPRRRNSSSGPLLVRFRFRLYCIMCFSYGAYDGSWPSVQPSYSC